MKVKSTQKFFALVAILILFTTPALAQYHMASAASSTGIMIPLYSYPGTYWTQVIQAKNAHPSVPIVVIINPNNGPGSSIDSNYVSGIQQLQAAGITVLGYVYTSYGARSASSIESDIHSYSSWYHVNGINFDEMANTAGYENYYSNLSSYAKSLGMTMTVGNPGTSTLASYVGTVDVLDIYESAGLPLLSDLQSSTFNGAYAKSSFAFIAFGVSSLPSQSTITSYSDDVGYLYLTNDVLPNPYDTVPSYLSTEVGLLDTGSTNTVPSAPTGLCATAVSSSQINLSWTAPSNNGGSAITGYKVERSADSGAVWSTIVSNTANTLTSYSDAGLGANSTYAYRVSAINSVGSSAPSNVATATTAVTGGNITVPSAPTGLVARSIGHSKVSLSWVAPSSNGGSPLTGYWIMVSTNNSTFTTLAKVGPNSTSYTAGGLHHHTTYYFKVFAMNSIGSGPSSNVATAKT